ncbi:MAG: hypothetical protein AB1571_00890 [Nanoarchaeota archaeon]
MRWGLKYWLIAFLLVIAVANAGEYTPDANTVALYHFNEGSGNITYDSSGSGYDGYLYNGPLLIQQIKGWGLVVYVL